MKFSKGFTLVETLVAISILVIAITATLNSAAEGLSGSVFAREQVTAFYLAQDAIEHIKNLRDQNSLQAVTSWTDFKSSLVTMCDSVSCRVDTSIVGDMPEPCSGDECTLLQDEDSGLYGYADGAQTPFTRTVRISDTTNPDEMKIVVSVAWNKGQLSRTFNVTEFILNWQ